MIDLKTLGDTVRTIRLERGLSQGQVAKAAGISTTFLSEIERAYVNPRRGGGVRPSDENISGIAKVLGISPTVLHNAMGRLELPEESRKQIEEEYTQLTKIVHEQVQELEAEGRWIATYRELSPRSRRIVNKLIEELDADDEGEGG